MRSIRWVAAAAAVSAFSAGVAVAGSQTSETTAVTADFQAGVVSQSQRQCDANHVKFRVVFEGTQTSSDARLTGKLRAKVVSVVNTQNGYGWSKAKVRVSDAATGKPKFNGHAVGVIEPGGGVEGFLAGRTVGPGSMRLLANFNAQQDQNTGAITGEFGKDSQSAGIQDPAILTNACRGGKHGDHGNHARRGGNDDHGRRNDD